ncbi:DNA-binding response regulator [Parabacteroides sp. 52]|uniref:LytR/AlgR family response regulator transcription factor n=1 Tax=unclassified Parabacteroides TaxID=2649774 RepID=UPI0013D48522|nr:MULTISPECIES: LytTR family DNA-binding domain-containing protein [unclassified Parabacteroides]MDH6535171.1 DNA-binding LytR/AlgR family response regulator [Parabacteroides sp. PM5-20]NDV56210.1 DNA-binding response regulator [Parabacteroides sp. 52]
MIRCIAIDDEPLALTQLTGYIQKVPFLELVKACSNAFEALSVISHTQVDLIFADIHMPDLNGMDFVKSLSNKPMIIFTTAYSEYAVESFRIDALDYLLKPFGFNDFLKAANKAHHHMDVFMQPATTNQQPAIQGGEKEENYLFVKADYKMLRLDVNKIIYIESQSEYARIFSEDSKPIMTLLSMKILEERLPAHTFMRIHRSYIVNLKKIIAVANNRIICHKDTYIPIGNQYKKLFNSYLEKHSFGKI